MKTVVTECWDGSNKHAIILSAWSPSFSRPITSELAKASWTWGGKEHRKNPLKEYLASVVTKVREKKVHEDRLIPVTKVRNSEHTLYLVLSRERKLLVQEVLQRKIFPT